MTHPPFGIGHNKGPEPGRGFRRHCWRIARRKLLGKTMPLEVVRMRVRRARQLGLAYPQYAAILMGSGRDVIAFLYTTEALGLRLARRLEMPGPVREKLSALEGAERLAFAPEGECPAAFREELSAISSLPFAAAGRPPSPAESWGAARQAVRAILSPLKLPSDAVVLIGSRESERAWAEAGKLAHFLPKDRYFAADAADPQPTASR